MTADAQPMEFDALTAVETLEATGIERGHAVAITQIVNNARAGVVTNDDDMRESIGYVKAAVKYLWAAFIAAFITVFGGVFGGGVYIVMNFYERIGAVENSVARLGPANAAIQAWDTLPPGYQIDGAGWRKREEAQ